MLSKGCLALRQSVASLPFKPLGSVACSNLRLFSGKIDNADDAKKAKEAVGMEKPLGKEGAESMEPAGVMENKQGAAEEYSELIGKHKQQNEKMLKGAKPADLYRENAKATSAANAKPGGDDLLDKQTHDR
ncbi:hypothetical protein COCSUDRAFT_39882 [Coccomyxa subellipsoidea C-169]|uniref:Uncharacterized protein n=1 Tax=Coccomyxa subellipsoidea (strain C-169) TaxID=574566 RepID=I0Z8G4_COCSC|nr:hypothetical protein COCSUDRAFT_39882 [Coccomyxa subellipsoidea C-169]EIE26933.1 hypothetical protein COCSUDRAFT_39882 [Coccomyxa subellipsoidea C-169]|eukprot:XP_005651477.1 hypothetical protein COCSUDRAFT_39882 [Coccomyxa subellipsoidea C-169]